ncbi:hypothetical protein A2867_02500 [Candidatus Daviesbacteria bacterium RIFCSPHIGHO2_01_FULL_40_11]|uniref:Uncharacterized protein n=1 Tax=Candidatus Daviesbacteria bacterium RIFCSPHIGHO2_01_FULL_40_11 TaxID=1797762 RepID=A0A1F5JFJ3_9BACT|nr:MAG: hypothetical protein A2867_02500 [Candidatus Daviesbacteria bacterium RIFCSPHIGHO2_01_FULL_40_11]
MVKKSLQTLIILPLTFGSFLGADSTQHFVSPLRGEYLLAHREMSLDNRYENKFVNDVFKNNILLNLAHMNGRVSKASDIKWDEIAKPFQYEFKLDPNKTFTFHEDVKATYRETLAKTTNAHFNAQEGFKTDGYLFGDGICHLASLINWVAKEAGLSVEALTNHDFANIPDIPKEFGVSIYNIPGSLGSNELQNLYITNNKAKPISFKFEYLDNKLKVSVVELN